MKVRKFFNFLLGLVVGFFFAHGLAYLFLYLLFSEDELQKEVSSKARCKAYEEILFLTQDPEERLKFVEEHKNILAKCAKEN